MTKLAENTRHMDVSRRTIIASAGVGGILCGLWSYLPGSMMITQAKAHQGILHTGSALAIAAHIVDHTDFRSGDGAWFQGRTHHILRCVLIPLVHLRDKHGVALSPVALLDSMNIHHMIATAYEGKNRLVPDDLFLEARLYLGGLPYADRTSRRLTEAGISKHEYTVEAVTPAIEALA